MSIQLDMNYISFFGNIVVGALSYMSNSAPITLDGVGAGEASYNYFYKIFLENPGTVIWLLGVYFSLHIVCYIRLFVFYVVFHL
jgi:hypothetical protein